MNYNYARHLNNDRSLSDLLALQKDAKRFQEAQSKSEALKLESKIWRIANYSFPSGKDYVKQRVERKSGIWTEFVTSMESTTNRAVELFIDYLSRQITGLTDAERTVRTFRYQPVHVDRSESILDSLSKEMLSNLSTLSSFSSLEKGWDGYRADPLDKRLIEFSRALVSSLPQDRQPDIFPTPRGTIQFEYEKNNGRYLEIEVSLGTFELYGKFPNGETFIDTSVIDWQSVLYCIEWVNAE